jgi:hypothetical protein
MFKIEDPVHNLLKSTFNYVPANKTSILILRTYYLRAALTPAYLNKMAFVQSLLSKEKAKSK